MTILFLILIIVASIVLSLLILIQNPKGGGLSGSIAGFSSQFMGVKQTTDVLEKGTWIFVTIIGVMSLFSVFFMGSGDNSQFIKGINTNQQQQTTPVLPQQSLPASPQEAPVQP